MVIEEMVKEEMVKEEMVKEGKRNEKVQLDNDVSELDILGHFGTIQEDFLKNWSI